MKQSSADKRLIAIEKKISAIPQSIKYYMNENKSMKGEDEMFEDKVVTKIIDGAKRVEKAGKDVEGLVGAEDWRSVQDRLDDATIELYMMGKNLRLIAPEIPKRYETEEGNN
jgi:hypothetical protein